MSNSDCTRRGLLKAGGAAGTAGLAGLAGCSGTDTGSETENGQQREEDEETSPEYEVELNAEDIDLKNEDTYNLGLEINRILDGETETLTPDQYEIKNAFQVRDHPEYNPELFEQHDILYEDILENINQVEEQGLTIEADEVLPGQTQFGIEIEIQDTEYNQNTVKQVNDTANINSNQEHLQNRLTVDQPRLWEELRQDYLENHVLTDEWDEAVKNIKKSDRFTENIQGETWRRKLRIAGIEWASEARDILGRGGTSIYAREQAATLEYLFPEVHAFHLTNDEHNTTLAYVEEEDKIYHVDSVGGAGTTFPPKDHSAVEDYNSALDRDNSDSSKMLSANANSAMINHQRTDLDPSLRNMFVEEDLRESSQEVLREGQGFDQLFDFHKEWGLSAGLTPSLDFTAKGTVEDPEVEIE